MFWKGCHIGGLHVDMDKSVVSGALNKMGDAPHFGRSSATLRLRTVHLTGKSFPFSPRLARLKILVWLVVHRFTAPHSLELTTCPVFNHLFSGAAGARS
jgi:hypothetical protein